MTDRLRLTTWVAFADFFSAIALVALALYGHQRHENIRVTRDVKDLARRIHQELLNNGIESKLDEANAAIVLPDTVLFDSGKFQIRDPVHRERVRKIGEVLRRETHTWQDRFILVIRGHTDAWPPHPNAFYSSNLELSWLRALEVEKAFVALGIHPPGFQIAAQGVGQEEPLIDNCRGPSTRNRAYCRAESDIRDGAELAKNRRIELKFGHFSGNAQPAL